jgi:hypothetical protein
MRNMRKVSQLSERRSDVSGKASQAIRCSKGGESLRTDIVHPLPDVAGQVPDDVDVRKLLGTALVVPGGVGAGLAGTTACIGVRGCGEGIGRGITFPSGFELSFYVIQEFVRCTNYHLWMRRSDQALWPLPEGPDADPSGDIESCLAGR